VSEPGAEVLLAVEAARTRKAEDVRVLDLSEVASFTDFFVIASGTNPRQVQAIANAVQEALRARGARPTHVEGYAGAEWILLDYGDLVVHVFEPRTREHYALERLWHDAREVALGGDGAR